MIAQLIYIIGGILVLPFLPALYLQGKRVKMGMQELPPASENLTGQIGINKDAKYNLLLLGESSIAGIGVNNHLDGIVGNIAKHLHKSSGVTVRWNVLAKSGYTAEMVRKKLVVKIPPKRVDIIVLGLGANDAFHLYSPKRWEQSICSLLLRLRNKYPNVPIVIANLPPVGEFPAFPFLMRSVLGILIYLFTKTAKKIPAKFSNVFFVDNAIRLERWVKLAGKDKQISDLFVDGVHPSALGYELWGKEVANFIIENKILSIQEKTAAK
jgi:lysophospholipase L1-like esterase